MTDLLDLAIWASEQGTHPTCVLLILLGYTDDTLPMMLINDCLDASTIQRASDLFQYMESRAEKLTQVNIEIIGNSHCRVWNLTRERDYYCFAFVMNWLKECPKQNIPTCVVVV